MRLKSITPINIGPFYQRQTTIPIEPTITTITGPNDVGKTILLQLLAITFGNSEPTTDQLQRLRNTEHLHDSTRATGADVGCDLTLEATKCDEQQDPGLTAGTTITAHVDLTKDQRASTVTSRTDPNGATTSPGTPLNARLYPISLPYPHLVDDLIAHDTTKIAEQTLLRTAFGPAYQERLKALPEGALHTELQRGEQRLNNELRALLPASTRLHAVLRKVDNRSIGINFYDENGSLNAPSFRGAGLNRMISHLAGLLAATTHEHHDVLLLFDEPETSLHADLQHALRTFLERIAEQPHIQVIYATHAPSMINTRRPTTTRLLEKHTPENRTVARLVTEPYGNNWYQLRAGLGLSAADSLLYGDITTIVEGITEVLSLPLALDKLITAKLPGFREHRATLEQMHFLPGDGDSTEYLVRLATSQRNHVAVLLDSDKQQLEESLKRDHPAARVVRFPEPLEFEDLVPPERYLQALQALVAEGPAPNLAEQLTLAAYETWKHTANLPDRMLFSKRIERWAGTLGVTYGKAEVMRRAIELTTPEELHARSTPLRELLVLVQQLTTEPREP